MDAEKSSAQQAMQGRPAANWASRIANRSRQSSRTTFRVFSQAQKVV